jgi:hypothetical protein
VLLQMEVQKGLLPLRTIGSLYYFEIFYSGCDGGGFVLRCIASNNIEIYHEDFS